MKYGYARVSTAKQDLTSQIEALKNEQCDKIITEIFTGTNTDRPKFKTLIEQLVAGDMLVVTKLDRFARSTGEALTIIQELYEKNVTVHVLNIGKIENTPSGRLIFTVFSAFATFERDLIVERTQEGKEIAKLNPNFKDGRPYKYTKAQMEHALALKRTHSYKQVQEKTGISKSTLWRYMNK